MRGKKKKKEDKPLKLFTKNTKLLHSKSTYFYKQQWLNSKLIPAGCALALLGIICASLQPIDTSSSHALDSENNAASELQTTLSLDISDNNDSTPAIAGETAYRSHEVTVAATNVLNYGIYITAAENATPELRLEGGDFAIAGASGEQGVYLKENTWGVGWSDLDELNSVVEYYSIPEYGTIGSSRADGLLASGYTVNVNLKKKMTFAAKIGDNAPGGHYKTNVIVSLAVQPKEVIRTITDIDLMQEMTTQICDDSAEHESKQLIDARGVSPDKYKKYWVTKLKDGNCWMTQNLALDLTIDGLTTESSNIAENWNSKSKYPPVATKTTPYGWNTVQSTNYKSAIQSYNPGLYVYTTPETSSNCPDTTVGLSACITYGWQDVSDWTASPDPEFNQIIDSENKIYNAHYLSGNYYSFNAIAAGSAPTAAKTITSSICPKGWILPLVGNENDNKPGSLASLLSYYGIIDGTQPDDRKIDFYEKPLYLYPAGSLYDGKIGSPGSWNDPIIWTGSTYGYGTPYLMFSSLTYVDLTYSTHNAMGIPVRCAWGRG